MCDTQEHIKIGEKSFSAAIEMLDAGRAGHGYDMFRSFVKARYAPYPYPDSDKSFSRPILFELTNKSQVSYGDVLGLAGDFYPEFASIYASRGHLEHGHVLLLDDDARSFDNAAVPKRGEINAILSAYHHLLDGKKWTVGDMEDARPGIKLKPLPEFDIDIPIVNRRVVHVAGGRSFAEEGDLGRVLRLALNNPDHFLFEAIEKWERYHTLAWRIAAEGREYFDRGDTAGYLQASGKDLPENRGKPDPLLVGQTRDPGYPLVNSLLLALRYNAFGDHFLSDLFSSGHMRTPRADLMKTFSTSEFVVTSDLLSYVTDGDTVDLASVLSGIQHDEDGRYGLWCELLLGKVRIGKLSAALPALEVDQFFARGDGHFLQDINETARQLCYRAVALSVRDVLFASIIGRDPREATHYWTPFGGDTQGARWASLRLVPRPLPHGEGWNVDPLKRKNGAGHYVNHPAFAMPDSGSLDGRWSALRDFVQAKGAPSASARTFDSCLIRARPMTLKGHKLPGQVESDVGTEKLPGLSMEWFNLAAKLRSDRSSRVGKGIALYLIGSAVKYYLQLKGLPGFADDNAAAQQ